MFIKIALLEHGLAHSFILSTAAFTVNSKAEQLQLSPYGPKSLEYLL